MATHFAFLIVARCLASAAGGDGRSGTVRGATVGRRLRQVFRLPAWDEDQDTCTSRAAERLEPWERGYDTRAACCRRLFSWSVEKRQLCEGGGATRPTGRGKASAAPKARASSAASVSGDEDGSNNEDSDSEHRKPIKMGCNEPRGPCRTGRPANFRQKKRQQKSRRKKKDETIKGGKRPESNPNMFPFP